MRNNRKYGLMLVLSLVSIALLTLVGLREPARLEAAAKARQEKTVAKGAVVFAANCVSCHGPVGEGHIGMPLNRAELQGDPEKNKSVYDFLVKTVASGRVGTADPTWRRAPDGNWMSYTAMPAWSQRENGPLDDQAVAAVATLIMSGQWDKVGEHIAPPSRKANIDEDMKAMPDAKGLSAADNTRGKRAFIEKGCIACHAVGSTGGRVGPDLSKVGVWGFDANFLREWIKDPPAKADRMPVWWSKHRTIGPDPNYKDPVKFGNTVMPKLLMTDEERDAIVNYLINLK